LRGGTVRGRPSPPVLAFGHARKQSAVAEGLHRQRHLPPAGLDQECAAGASSRGRGGDAAVQVGASWPPFRAVPVRGRGFGRQGLPGGGGDVGGWRPGGPRPAGGSGRAWNRSPSRDGAGAGGQVAAGPSAAGRGRCRRRGSRRRAARRPGRRRWPGAAAQVDDDRPAGPAAGSARSWWPADQELRAAARDETAPGPTAMRRPAELCPAHDVFQRFAGAAAVRRASSSRRRQRLSSSSAASSSANTQPAVRRRTTAASDTSRKRRNGKAAAAEAEAEEKEEEKKSWSWRVRFVHGGVRLPGCRGHSPADASGPAAATLSRTRRVRA